MDDLISRQAAIDALSTPHGILYPIRTVEELPSVQPRTEIIRCKDCKHYRPRITCVEGHYNGCDAWLDNGNEIEVAPDDYCSYAERRTDEGD